MAIVSLNSDLIEFENFDMSLQFGNIFVGLPNGFSRPIFRNSFSRIVRTNFIALTDEARSYLRGTIMVAGYATDQVLFNLPREYTRYTGSATETIRLRSDATQGSNTIIVENASDSSFPVSTDFYPGMHFNLEADNGSRLYTVDNYTPSTGTVVFAPYLHTSYDADTEFLYQDPYMLGNIVSSIDEGLLPYNFQFLRVPTIIQEYVV